MYKWQFSTKKEKSASWYTTAFGVCAVLIIYGFYQGMYFLSIVVLILIGVYFLVENNSPDNVDVEVTEHGILMGDSFYDYPKIENFYIAYDKNVPVLLRIHVRTGTVREIDAPLVPGIQVPELRTFLLQYIDEDKDGKMRTGDKMINYLKL